MPRHLISDAHEWINEIPTVPIYYLAKPQPRERAWQNQRGKKTLFDKLDRQKRRPFSGARVSGWPPGRPQGIRYGGGLSQADPVVKAPRSLIVTPARMPPSRPRGSVQVRAIPARFPGGCSRSLTLV